MAADRGKVLLGPQQHPRQTQSSLGEVVFQSGIPLKLGLQDPHQPVFLLPCLAVAVGNGQHQGVPDPGIPEQPLQDLPVHGGLSGLQGQTTLQAPPGQKDPGGIVVAAYREIPKGPYQGDSPRLTGKTLAFQFLRCCLSGEVECILPAIFRGGLRLGALEKNVQSQERPHCEKHCQEDPDTEQPVFLPVGPEAGEGKMIQG